MSDVNMLNDDDYPIYKSGAALSSDYPLSWEISSIMTSNILL